MANSLNKQPQGSGKNEDKQMKDKKEEAEELVAMSLELIRLILSKQMAAVIEEFNAEVDKRIGAKRVIDRQNDYLTMMRDWMNRRGVLSEFEAEYPYMRDVLGAKKRQ